MMRSIRIIIIIMATMEMVMDMVITVMEIMATGMAIITVTGMTRIMATAITVTDMGMTRITVMGMARAITIIDKKRD